MSCCSTTIFDSVWSNELHAVCRFHKRDFDELMHLHSHSATTRTASLNLSPFTSLKCCLILPCEATDEEIFRVGKHLHSILKLQGSLYYRTLNDNEGTLAASTVNDRHNTLSDLLDEDGKMTEDSFRRFARYRIKRDEVRQRTLATMKEIEPGLT